MSIFFHDPHEVRLPPEEVHLKSIQVFPLGEGGRIRVQIELSYFLRRPNLEVIVTNPAGEEVAHTTILETLLTKLELTMHLREYEPGMEYHVETKVYYQQLPQAGPVPAVFDQTERMIVDRNVTVFKMQQPAP